MRTLRLTATLAAVAALSLAPLHAVRAQTKIVPPAATPAQVGPGGAPDGKPADPVVAKVGGQDIRLSDLSEMAQTLPEQYRNMPVEMLFPMLQDQAIDRAAIGLLARKEGLDKDPAVAKQMARASEQSLENALISRDVGPMATDAAVRASYDRDIAGKSGETEVHARHILVADEAEAKKLIVELKAGGDFAALAKAHSTDPGAANGGDLGWFKKGDMLPEFSAVAFALKPGQIADTPVKTRYGWHVIKVEEVRQAPPPTFEASRDEIRQKLIQEGIQKVLASAREGLKVEKFKADGTPALATDDATPPPAPAPAPTKK